MISVQRVLIGNLTCRYNHDRDSLSGSLSPRDRPEFVAVTSLFTRRVQVMVAADEDSIVVELGAWDRLARFTRTRRALRSALRLIAMPRVSVTRSSRKRSP